MFTNAPRLTGRGFFFAPVTLYQFRLLSPEVQLYYVLSEGAYMAQRWEGEFQGVNLYFCDDGGRGFFVEVGINEVRECIVVLRSFRSTVPLEDYIWGVKLPEGWA